MKRLLQAALLLLLGPGAWGQPQPGVGVLVNPVPGSGSNAAASTLRMDLGGANPAAPASSILGLSLPAPFTLSPKVSPTAVSEQAAAPAASLGVAGSARVEDGPRAGTGARGSRAAEAAPASLRDRKILSSFDRGAPAASMVGNSQEAAAISHFQDLSRPRTAQRESRKASTAGYVVLKDLAASPLGHRRAFDGDIQRPGTDADASILGKESVPSPRANSLLRPGAAGVEAGGKNTPSPVPGAPSRIGERPPSGDGGPLAADPEPFKLPLWKRALAVTGILGFLAAAPSVLNAAALQTVGQAVLPSLSAGSALSIFTQNAALLLSPWAWGIAAALALIGLPLRLFVFRLSPWGMHWLKDPGNGLAKKPLWMLLPLLAVAAASEELTFRAMAFGLSFVFLSTLMAAPLALAAASFFSSLVFALLHGYGPVWTRVVGGMLYSAAFAVTGSLLFITLAHMLFNLRALSLARRSNG